MNKYILIILILSLSHFLKGQDDPFGESEKRVTQKIDDAYFKDLTKIQQKYRESFSQLLLSANVVKIYIVKFDDLKKLNEFEYIESEENEKIIITSEDGYKITLLFRNYGKEKVQLKDENFIALLNSLKKNFDN